MKKLIILLGCLYPFFLFGQGKIFNGEVVSDQDNQPLVGVTVLEKGTYNAVITDVNGNFNIKTQGTSPILVFSFVGMITQEHPAKTDMKIRLKEDVLQLEEVMVTAYGTSKKASFTGSASVIDNKKSKSYRYPTFPNSCKEQDQAYRLSTATDSREATQP